MAVTQHHRAAQSQLPARERLVVLLDLVIGAIPVLGGCGSRLRYLQLVDVAQPAAAEIEGDVSLLCRLCTAHQQQCKPNECQGSAPRHSTPLHSQSIKVAL